MEKKKKPNFNVLNFGFFKSVKSRWRKPRGTHNKKRMKFRWAGALPRIGYKNPKELRGLHPSGMREVLVSNVAGLDGLKDVVVRIASSVGARKRAVMEEKAKTLKLKVVNASVKKPAFAPTKAAPKTGAPRPAVQKAAVPATASKPATPKRR